jgi:hypothetical protein
VKRPPDTTKTDTRWGFFIGPDKAGSSWIQVVLEEHPAVAVPVSKDLFYFDRFHQRGIEWYLRQFEVTARTEVCVEVCHDYLFSPDAIGRLASEFPEARLVLCARSPVDRAVSSFLYMRRQGRTSLDFSRAIRTIDELIDHGRYHEHLMHVLDHFAVDQVTVLDFELLASDPRELSRGLFVALGAPAFALPDELLEPVRAAAAARSRILGYLGRRGALLLRRMRAERLLARLKFDPRLERLLFRDLHADERPVVAESDLSYLHDHLADDARRLDALLGTSFGERWWGTSGSMSARGVRERSTAEVTASSEIDPGRGSAPR